EAHCCAVRGHGCVDGGGSCRGRCGNGHLLRGAHPAAAPLL
ncbi:MAG: hypothetical protein AVDCRST_MAG30-1369, partial [uncultured Solirubrobacteraceae bacterium]